MKKIKTEEGKGAKKPVGTIKKFATGNGRAGKPLIIAAARSWGFEPADDNEADALALLHYLKVNT